MGREKPWGTAQALLAARNCIKEPFAVINADDFYGRSAYEALAKHLSSVDVSTRSNPYCMVGYVLENTLTENGTGSRGICNVGDDGFLIDVVERTSIRRGEGVALYEENGADTELPFNAIASMNCWGFTPDIFEKLSEGFAEFLSQKHSDELKCEY